MRLLYVRRELWVLRICYLSRYKIERIEFSLVIDNTFYYLNTNDIPGEPSRENMTPSHGRNTRGSGELDLPICRLKTGQRSFAFRGAKLYNNLPNEIKQTSDVKKFKAKVCNYLLNL